MHLDAVVCVDPAAGRDRGPAGAERAQRLLGNLRPLKRKRLARVVLGPDEARDAERLAHRARQNAEADDAERLQPFEHLTGERALQHLPFQRVVVDEQRRVQRVERRFVDAVEGTGARPAQIGLAGFDVADQSDLGVGRALAPADFEVDAQGSL